MLTVEYHLARRALPGQGDVDIVHLIPGVVPCIVNHHVSDSQMAELANARLAGEPLEDGSDGPVL